MEIANRWRSWRTYRLTAVYYNRGMSFPGEARVQCGSGQSPVVIRTQAKPGCKLDSGEARVLLRPGWSPGMTNDISTIISSATAYLSLTGNLQTRAELDWAASTL